MPAQSKYWFPAKRYGWGWGVPATWQGWLALSLYLALIGAGAAVLLPSRRPGVFVGYVAFLSVLLIAVCWIKGEPPHWHWGKHDRG